MNNLSSYCGLFDAKIRASDKDLPVRFIVFMKSKLTDLKVYSSNESHFLIIDQNSFTLFGQFNLKKSWNRDLEQWYISTGIATFRDP